MFNRENVYGMVTGFNVRVKDEREQDRNHLIEATFELPLTYDLADEIQPAMARDLFQDVRGEWSPKPEMSLAQFALAPAPQLLVLRNHPDLDPEVRINQVFLRRIQAKKSEAGSWLLTFTATWTLGDLKEAIVMIQRLKLGAYLTLVEQQPKLDMNVDADQVVDGQVVTTDGQGNVTSLTKRKRGRPKKNPGPDPVLTQPCPQCASEVPVTVRVCPQCAANVPAQIEGPTDDTPTDDGQAPVH